MIYDSSIMIAPTIDNNYSNTLKSTSSMIDKSKCKFVNFKKPSRSPLPSLKEQLTQVCNQNDWSMNPHMEQKIEKKKYQRLSPLPTSFIRNRFYNIKPKLLREHKEFKSESRTGIKNYKENSIFSSQSSLKNTLRNSKNLSYKKIKPFSEEKKKVKTSFYTKLKDRIPLKAQFKNNIKKYKSLVGKLETHEFNMKRK